MPLSDGRASKSQEVATVGNKGNVTDLGQGTTFLIGSTTTHKGLTIKAQLNERKYQKGLQKPIHKETGVKLKTIIFSVLNTA